MMTVFYYPDGRIYGLHPSGQPVKGGVPDGIQSIEVETPPHRCERTHVVDLANKVLMPKPPPPPDPRDTAKAAIDKALTSKATADILAALAAVREVL